MATRLTPTHLLSHPVRVALVDLIRAEPGIPFLGLYQRLKPVPGLGSGLGHGSLSYHLQVLEKWGHVTSRRSGRHRRYYENGGPWNGDTTALSLLQVSRVAEVARLVLDHPGLSQRLLWHRYAGARRLTRQAIGYRLQALERAELVTVAQRGRAKAYYGTERLARLLLFLGTALAPQTPSTIAAALASPSESTVVSTEVTQ